MTGTAELGSRVIIPLHADAVGRITRPHSFFCYITTCTSWTVGTFLATMITSTTYSCACLVIANYTVAIPRWKGSMITGRARLTGIIACTAAGVTRKMTGSANSSVALIIPSYAVTIAWTQWTMITRSARLASADCRAAASIARKMTGSTKSSISLVKTSYTVAIAWIQWTMHTRKTRLAIIWISPVACIAWKMTLTASSCIRFIIAYCWATARWNALSYCWRASQTVSSRIDAGTALKWTARTRITAIIICTWWTNAGIHIPKNK